MKNKTRKVTALLAVFIIFALAVSTLSYQERPYASSEGEVIPYWRMIPPFWAVGGLVALQLFLVGGVKEKFAKSLRPTFMFITFMVLCALLFGRQRLFLSLAPLEERPPFALMSLYVERVAPWSPSFGYGMEFLTGFFGVLTLRSLWWLIREKGWREPQFEPSQLLYLLLPIALGYAEVLLLRGGLRTMRMDGESWRTVLEIVCRMFTYMVLVLPMYSLTTCTVPLSRGAAMTIGGLSLLFVVRTALLPLVRFDNELSEVSWTLYYFVQGNGWLDTMLFPLPLCLAIKALWVRRKERKQEVST